MKRPRILKVWNETEFKLYVPAKIDANNKIEAHFSYLNQETGKNKPIKKVLELIGYAKEKVYTQQSNLLVEWL